MTGVLVHEWISRTGGSEKVFDAMVEAFPEAAVLTLWNDDRGRRYPGRDVSESWLARTPLRRTKALALPFMPMTWRNQRREGLDWALVSSHLFAHHASFVGASAGFRKYVYVHTPARYIWTPDLDPRGSSLLARLASRCLQPLDRRRAHEAHAVAANSEYVRERIADTWGVDATVIYPPVDVDEIRAVTHWSDVLDEQDSQALRSLPSPYLFGASRFVSYKRLDRVIEAGEAAGLPVVIAGAGPLRDALVARGKQASVPVRVIDRPSDSLLYALFQEALAYVFPAVEDFGIMPVEAMATGTPVIATRLGGAAESVVDGVTGVLVSEAPTPQEWRAAVKACSHLQRADIVARADFFSAANFTTRLERWMEL